MKIKRIQENEVLSIRTHLVIALFCLPLYEFGGEAFKLAIAPYVLYMLYNMNPKFIPAVLVHFINGSTMSFLILFMCLIISIKNYKELKELNIFRLLLLTLLPFPIIFYTVYLKITVHQENFVGWISFLFMYFGLFPFFYFALLAKKFKLIHVKYIFIVLALAVVLQLLDSTYVRYLFLSLPIFIVVFVISLKDFFKSSNQFFLLFWSLIIVLIVLSSGLTSTLLFTSLIAVILSLYYLRRNAISTRSPYLLLFTTTAVVIYSVLTYDPSSQQILNYDVSAEVFDITDIDGIINRAKFKLFEDRTPLWYSVYQGFIIDGTLLPPYEMKNYQYFTISGSEVETDLPSHNIFLELIKTYGILCGAILSIIYISMIIKSSRLLSFKRLNVYLIAATTCVISCGFFGGMTGQYLLLGSFSFLFMGISGLCYGLYRYNRVPYINDIIQ